MFRTSGAVQVDPAAAPAAGWVAGEGGVAARSPPTGSRVTVEWLPYRLPVPRRPVRPAAGTGRYIYVKNLTGPRALPVGGGRRQSIVREFEGNTCRHRFRGVC